VTISLAEYAGEPKGRGFKSHFLPPPLTRGVLFNCSRSVQMLSTEYETTIKTHFHSFKLYPQRLLFNFSKTFLNEKNLSESYLCKKLPRLEMICFIWSQEPATMQSLFSVLTYVHSFNAHDVGSKILLSAKSKTSNLHMAVLGLSSLIRR